MATSDLPLDQHEVLIQLIQEMGELLHKDPEENLVFAFGGLRRYVETCLESWINVRDECLPLTEECRRAEKMVDALQHLQYHYGWSS
jgi:hypothetical protein